MTGSDIPKPRSIQRVLVLGGYGFLGAAIVAGLQKAGLAVSVFGRRADLAARVLPGVAFVQGDLAQLTQPEAWKALLQDIDLVVNAAGQLQASEAELNRVQHLAIAALGRICAQQGTGVIQISAAGAGQQASTSFLRSKARADADLMVGAKAGARIWVLRPGLVLGQGSFGGTALLRMLAAVPVVQPLALGTARIQCVGLMDVSRVVVEAATGELPPGCYDLVEDEPHELQEILAQNRAWLGFAPARSSLTLPSWMVSLTAWLADGLGHLGWRSPMRRTAIAVLEDGVSGDPTAYRAASGKKMATLAQILSGLRAGREHRLEARMLLLMPFVVGLLFAFWACSGIVAIWQLDRAAMHLTEAGWSSRLATVAVLFWAVVDIALALALLWRPWATRACLGMAMVTLIYLGAASVVTPVMWSDPLGPLVKVLPGFMLALVAHQLLQER